VIFLCFLFY